MSVSVSCSDIRHRTRPGLVPLSPRMVPVYACLVTVCLAGHPVPTLPFSLSSNRPIAVFSSAQFCTCSGSSSRSSLSQLLSHFHTTIRTLNHRYNVCQRSIFRSEIVKWHQILYYKLNYDIYFVVFPKVQLKLYLQPSGELL